MINFFIEHESYVNFIAMAVFIIGMVTSDIEKTDTNKWDIIASVLFIAAFTALSFSVFINIIVKGF